MVKSVYYSDKEILKAILDIHVNSDRFDLDPCFSKGVIYRGLKKPSMVFDLYPEDMTLFPIPKADCQDLPLKDNSVNSIVFDPPFMFGTHGQTKNNIMAKRFSMFDNFDELRVMYQNSLKEFNRILKKNGILAFKCQDYTETKKKMTHCLVWMWAIERGFYAKDLFVLVNESRIWNPLLVQRHARKTHCYYWVFQKISGNN